MKTIRIDRPVAEWRMKGIFGQTKVTWSLTPIEWTVKDPKTQKGAARRLAQRKERQS